MTSSALMLPGIAAGSLSAVYVLWSTWCRFRSSTVRNKVVLITGASSGIGEACAHEFYKAGAKLILCARRISELERVKKELQSLPTNNGSVDVVRLDLEDMSSMNGVVTEALAIHGHIDVLINNGGISNRGEVVNTSIETEVRVFTVNVLGTIAFTKAVLPSMVQRKRGHILCVSSIQSYFTIPNRACYGASKHAVQGYFDSLRAEIAHHGIEVTVFNPGYVKTNLSYNALTETGELNNKQSPEYETAMSSEYCARQIERAITLRRKEVLLAPLLHRIVVYVRTLCPVIYYKAMEMRAASDRKKAEKEK